MQGNDLPQDVIELRQSAPAVSARAQELAGTIVDQPTINAALAWCSSEQTIVDKVIARLSEGKKLAHAAWKEWCDLETDATKTRLTSIKFVKARIGEVQLAIQRQAREAEERRLAAERKKDEEARLAKAEELEKAGNSTAADAVLSEVGNFIAPVHEAPKPEGGNVRTVWKVRQPVKLTRELLLWLAGKPGFENALILDVKWLEKQQAQMAGNLKIPGIEFFEQPIVSIAARRSA